MSILIRIYLGTLLWAVLLFGFFPEQAFAQDTSSGRMLQPGNVSPSDVPWPIDILSKKNDPKIEVSVELFNAASFQERNLFSQAKSYFDQGNHEIAGSSLETFLLDYGESPLLPDAYILLSEMYRSKGEANRATQLLKTFLRLFPDESRVLLVRLRLSILYFKMGELKRVMALWNGVSDEIPAKHRVFDHLVRAYDTQKDILAALHVLMKKRAMRSEWVTPILIEEEIIFLVRERLNERDLLSIVKTFGGMFPTDEAMMRLIASYDTQGDYYHEEQMALQFVAQFPAHRYLAQVEQSLARIKGKIKSSRYLLAVILPLSGPLAVFGNQSLSGAELAIQLFKEELPGASVDLVVRNSEEDPSRLRITLGNWLEEYQPVAMVGPLLSKEVNRVAAVLEKMDMALITPGATARRLFSLGNTVFRNAVTNRFLCNAIAEYAVLELEAERFAVLFPDEPLGRRWVDCFSEGIEKLGGEVVLTEPYPLNDTDFSSTILRLKKADLEQDGFVEDIENENGDVEELYTPGFEAIFLPADAVRAGLIIPQLLFHEFNTVGILGTSSWNSEAFLKLTGSYANGVVFADGFFKESTDPVVETFVTRYRARFNAEPDLFAAQSYDATRLILAAMKKGALTPAKVKAAIAETVDFPGVSGFIYEVLEGELIKEPFFIQVDQGKFIQID